MMNINELSEEEKSVMLARAMGEGPEHYPKDRCPVCGWTYNMGQGCEPNNCSMRPPPKKRADMPHNFYDPVSMALAWRVLNWADKSTITIGSKFMIYWATYDLWAEPPEVAQREWLDKILQLAIEDGMIEETQ